MTGQNAQESLSPSFIPNLEILNISPELRSGKLNDDLETKIMNKILIDMLSLDIH